MGVCVSRNQIAVAVANKEIDTARSHKKQLNVVKLLLLGIGESGKSTILKQVGILHDKDYHRNEMRYHRTMIYKNIVGEMMTLITAVLGPNLVFDDADTERHAAQLVKAAANEGNLNEPFNEELFTALSYLWARPDVKDHFKHHQHKLHIQHSLRYFMDELERIARVDYEPTNQDLLYIRVPTTAVTQCTFTMNKCEIHVIDVGGQRSARRKWIHCFDNVDSLVYVASLTDYKESLREDESQNRMVESLKVFENTVNSQWFVNKSIILFLNKKDLLEEQVELYPLNAVFSEYTGANAYGSVLEHIKWKYERAVLQMPERRLYIYETCATDTDQVHKIIDSVIHITIEGVMQGIALK